MGPTLKINDKQLFARGIITDTMTLGQIADVSIRIGGSVTEWKNKTLLSRWKVVRGACANDSGLMTLIARGLVSTFKLRDIKPLLLVPMAKRHIVVSWETLARLDAPWARAMIKRHGDPSQAFTARISDEQAQKLEDDPDWDVLSENDSLDDDPTLDYIPWNKALSMDISDTPADPVTSETELKSDGKESPLKQSVFKSIANNWPKKA